MKNGREKGAANVELLAQFELSGLQLPVSPEDGTLNLSELSRMTGIKLPSFYQNQPLKERLEQLRLKQGIARRGISERNTDPVEPEKAALAQDKATAFLERKIQSLEQQNAVLGAEIYDLRRENKLLRLQKGRDDMVIETGRRIAIPPDAS